jgi:tetratricopeptide (TPR) repeat protein
MPPDARSVVRFADFLKEFYVKAGIPQRWILARPFYDREAEILGPPLRDAIRKADADLRATSGTATVRQMAVHVEMAAPKNSVNVQNNQEEYHVVVGNSTPPRIADIRHAYLHMSIDATLFSHMNSLSGAQPLLGLVAKEEGVAPEYTSDLFSMTRESLVRAIELRLDRPPAAEAASTANGYYRSGLLLLPYFQTALLTYEQDDPALPAYIPTLLAGIRVKDEQKRFQDTFRQIPLPPKANRPVETRQSTSVPQAPPPPDPKRALLVEASDAFSKNDTAKAKTLFERVLESDPDNGTALYGLALIAGREGDDKVARGHFEGVLRSTSSDAAHRVWAHIYLGRMDDNACQRTSAVEHYREAIKNGNDTRNAQSIAKEGVARSFRDDCEK